MSDNTDLHDDNDDDTTPAPQKDNWRRRLEAEAEEGRQAKNEAQQAKKELAFLKAGIDLNGELTPQQKLFVKAYDGDVSADAVKAAAVEYGVIETETPAVPAEELQAHQQIATAAAGGSVQSDADGWLAAVNSAESAQDVINALRTADPSLVDQVSKVTGWAIGGQNTPVTQPL